MTRQSGINDPPPRYPLEFKYIGDDYYSQAPPAYDLHILNEVNINPENLSRNNSRQARVASRNSPILHNSRPQTRQNIRPSSQRSSNLDSRDSDIYDYTLPVFAGFKNNIFCCCKNIRLTCLSSCCPCLVYCLIFKMIREKDQFDRHKKCSCWCSFFGGLLYLSSLILTVFSIYAFYYYYNEISEEETSPFWTWGAEGRVRTIYWEELRKNKFRSCMALLLGIFFLAFLAFLLRCCVRKRLNIRYNFCLDCVYGVFLPVCSMVQIGREVQVCEESCCCK